MEHPVNSINNFYNNRIEKDIVSMNNMNIWFKLMKRNPFVFSYVPNLASNSSYYNVYRDVIRNLPKIILQTLSGNQTVPGFTYTKISKK